MDRLSLRAVIEDATDRQSRPPSASNETTFDTRSAAPHAPARAYLLEYLMRRIRLRSG